MSSKTKFLFINIFLIIILLTLIFYNFIKTQIVFEINGESEIYVEANTKYKDLGATAVKYNLIFEEKKVDIIIENNVNTKKVGKYLVKYILNDSDVKLKKIRTVHIVDTTKPEIKIFQKEIISCNKELKKADYTAYDNYDGNITKKVKKSYNKDYIVFNVKDSNGNQTTKKIKIKDISNESPQISLNGDENIYLNQFEEYIELGAIAYDSCDGDLSSKITIINEVNPNVVGKYNVIYKVEDSYGNISKIIRKVHVITKKDEINQVVPEDAKIYLTFDDGPGEYTEELLNILDKYNVKATFFVTNQFPKYQYMIKEEYKRGHTIGVHTYSHLWNIYTSIDSYMADFNAINNIIYNQTGSYAKIFRFPGGSSNTISKKYNVGIMSVLAKKMLEDGYQYYDWNIDSTDTARRNTVESIVSNTTRSLKGNSYYIVLMHDIKENTIKALPQIIEYAISIGYEFSAITEDTPIVHSTIQN